MFALDDANSPQEKTKCRYVVAPVKIYVIFIGTVLSSCSGSPLD